MYMQYSILYTYNGKTFQTIDRVLFSYLFIYLFIIIIICFAFHLQI